MVYNRQKFKMKKYILILIALIGFGMSANAQYTVTITRQMYGNAGSGIIEFNNINLSQEIYINPTTPLIEGYYTGEVSWMHTKNRPGILIYSNTLSRSRGIFIHYGQYDDLWSKGCVILEVNGFTQMYEYLKEKLGMNGTFTIVVKYR
jgi:hypothetical protein